MSNYSQRRSQFLNSFCWPTSWNGNNLKLDQLTILESKHQNCISAETCLLPEDQNRPDIYGCTFKVSYNNQGGENNNNGTTQQDEFGDDFDRFDSGVNGQNNGNMTNEPIQNEIHQSQDQSSSNRQSLSSTETIVNNNENISSISNPQTETEQISPSGSGESAQAPPTVGPNQPNLIENQPGPSQLNPSQPNSIENQSQPTGNLEQSRPIQNQNQGNTNSQSHHQNGPHRQGPQRINQSRPLGNYNNWNANLVTHGSLRGSINYDYADRMRDQRLRSNSNGYVVPGRQYPNGIQYETQTRNMNNPTANSTTVNQDTATNNTTESPQTTQNNQPPPSTPPAWFNSWQQSQNQQAVNLQNSLTNAVQQMAVTIAGSFKNLPFTQQQQPQNQNISNISANRTTDRNLGLNGTFFQASFIKANDENNLFNYVKLKTRAMALVNKDLSLTKKSKAIQDADIPTWNRATYKSCLSFLWKTYHKQVSKISFLTPYECAAFLYTCFDPSLKEKVMQATALACQGFVMTEHLIDDCLEQNQPAVDNYGNDLYSQTMTMDKLRLCVYSQVAQAVQADVMEIDLDPWDHNSGCDLSSYFKECVDLIQIDFDSVSYKPNLKELALALKKMIKSLESNGQEEVAKALNMSQIIQKLLRRRIPAATLELVAEEIQGCYFVAEKALTDKSTTKPVTTVECSHVTTEEVNFTSTNYNNGRQTDRYNNRQYNNRPYNENPRNYRSFNDYNRSNYDRNYRPRFNQRGRFFSGDAFRNLRRYAGQYQGRLSKAFEPYRAEVETMYVNVLIEEEMIDDNIDDDYFEQLADSLAIGVEDPTEEPAEAHTINLASFDTRKKGFIHVRVNFNTSSNQTCTYAKGLLDSGSSTNIIKLSVVKAHGLDKYIRPLERPIKTTGFEGSSAMIKEKVRIYCTLGMINRPIVFLIGPDNMTQDCILGDEVLEMLGIKKAILQQLYKLKVSVEPSLGVNCASQTSYFVEAACQTEAIGLTAIEIPSLPTDHNTNQIDQVQTTENKDTKTQTTEIKEANKNTTVNVLDPLYGDPFEEDLDKKVRKSDRIDDEVCICKLATVSDENKNCEKENEKVTKINQIESLPKTPFPDISENIISEKNKLSVESSGGGVESIVFSKNSSIPSDTCNEINKISADTHTHIKTKHKKDKQNQRQAEVKLFDGLLKNLSTDQRRLMCTLIKLKDDNMWDNKVSLEEAGLILQTHTAPIALEQESDRKTFVASAEEVIIPKGSHQEVKVVFPEGCQNRSWVCTPFKCSHLHVSERIVLASSTEQTALHVSNFSGMDVKIHKGQRLAKAHLLNILDLPSQFCDNDVQKKKSLFTRKELKDIFSIVETIYNEELITTERQEHFINALSSGMINIKRATFEDEEKMKKIEKEHHEAKMEQFRTLIEDLEPELKEVMEEYSDRFTGDAEGEWRFLKARPIVLPVQPNHPRQVRPNYKKRFTEMEQKVIDDFVITSLSRKLISRSNSNILSPLLIIPKPNNRGFRVCCDYRNVNSRVFDFNSHCIPEINDIILRLGSKTIFSMFDIGSAYWRCRLAEGISKEATAFVVSQGEYAGIYEWNVLPFGPKAAVSLFSRIMDEALRGLKEFGILNYLDDIISGSGDKNMSRAESVTAHAADLRKFFDRARATNLTFSIEKTVVGKEAVEVLGMFLGGGSVKAGKGTIKKLNEVAESVDLSEHVNKLSSVIGFFNYSRKFIPYFSKGQRKIRKLKDDFDIFVKENPKKPTEVAALKKASEDEISKIIKKWVEKISDTSLAVPSKDDCLEIASDASGDSLGWVCRVEATGKIVELGSRCFSDTEKRYTIQERELLACAEALEKLKMFTHRAPKVKCLIDNKCAVSNIQSPNTCTSDRGIRFIMRIQSCPNAEFSYCTSKDNGCADYLSRERLLAEQGIDRKITINTTDSTPVQTENTTVRTTSTTQTCEKLEQEKLFRQIKEIHEQRGHPCQKRLLDVVKIYFPFAKNTSNLAAKVIEACPECTKFRRIGSAAHIGRMPIPTAPNQIIHMDHFSPTTGRDAVSNKSAVLSIRDSFSKYTAIFPCRGYSHSEILGHLRTWCMLFSPVKRIRCDNALTSDSIRNFCNTYGITLSPTPVYGPKTNGVVERVHKDLRKLFPLAISKLGLRSDNWCQALPKVAEWVNGNTHSVLKVAPNMVHFGHNTLDTKPDGPELWQDIRKRLETAQDKNIHDLAGPHKTTELATGTPVWAFLKDQRNPVPAIITKDLGKTVEIEKDDDSLTRFKNVPIDKCNISLRI